MHRSRSQRRSGMRRHSWRHSSIRELTPPPFVSTSFLTNRRARSITSILTCHFMLSLREFDSATRDSATASRHMASTVLQFGAQPSDSLPSFIASFAHPVHSIEMAALSEKDADAPVDDGPEWREMEVVAPILETPSCSSTAPAGPDEPSKLEHSV